MQRRGEGVELRQAHAAAELDAVDDVAPLVRAAELEDAAVAAVQLGEVVGLQDHVVELEEGQLVLALEAQLDRIHRQHAVDGEVAADVAQEIDVVERRQPLGVVDHDRVGLALAEGDEVGEGLAQALLVGLDLLVGEELAHVVLAGRVADPGRAAAHERDRPVAGLLEPAQHHDRDEVADVKARRRAVESDIGGDRAPGGLGVEALGVGELVDEVRARTGC